MRANKMFKDVAERAMEASTVQLAFPEGGDEANMTEAELNFMVGYGRKVPGRFLKLDLSWDDMSYSRFIGIFIFHANKQGEVAIVKQDTSRTINMGLEIPKPMDPNSAKFLAHAKKDAGNDAAGELNFLPSLFKWFHDFVGSWDRSYWDGPPDIQPLENFVQAVTAVEAEIILLTQMAEVLEEKLLPSITGYADTMVLVGKGFVVLERQLSTMKNASISNAQQRLEKSDKLGVLEKRAVKVCKTDAVNIKLACENFLTCLFEANGYLKALLPHVGTSDNYVKLWLTNFKPESEQQGSFLQSIMDALQVGESGLLDLLRHAFDGQ